MKLNSRFLIGVLLFLVLLLVAQWQMPRRFQWTVSFRHDSKQPFGCYVMDSLMKISIPQGYGVTDKSLYQLDRALPDSAIGVLIVTESFTPSDTDVSALLRLLRRGSHVMIVAGRTSENVDDSLGFGTYGGCSFNLSLVRRMVASGYSRDSLHWVGRRQTYPKRIYRVFPQIVTGELAVYTKKKYHTLYNKWSQSWITDSTMEWKEESAAVSQKIGDGQLTVCCDPLLFTNYTVLDQDNAHLTFRLMNEMDSLPILRTEAYLEKTIQSQSSPLSFVMRQPPLRWAVWLTAGGLLLFFLCTSRRRQRVIPVMSPPQNRSMEFIELIGTLYHQWHDNKDLVRKKYLFFAETLRRQLMIDVDDEASDGQSVDILSVHTGLRREVIRQRLKTLRQTVSSDDDVDDDDMRRIIDEMVEIEQLIGL